MAADVVGCEELAPEVVTRDFLLADHALQGFTVVEIALLGDRMES